MNLTPKQMKVLQLIRESRISRGYSPTMQELADELQVSKVTVFEHVEALIKKGALKREPNKARSLSLAAQVELPGSGSSALTFPLVGRIAAGHPIEKFADADELALDDLFGQRVGKRDQTFALRVQGDSMRDEGILDGDYVLVERRETAQNGQRVVALLPDGETTLKTYFKEPSGRIRLQPANPDFPPIFVKYCTIQGIIIGVLRRYS